MSTFILGPGPDAAGDLRQFAEEVAPAVREAVEQARAARPARAVEGLRAADSRGGGQPRGIGYAPPPGTEPGAGSLETAPGEAEGEAAEADAIWGSAGAQTLLAVHEHLRQELDQLREVMGEVADGRVSPNHLKDAETAVDRLADALLPHLRVEEDQLLGPIAELGIEV